MDFELRSPTLTGRAQVDRRLSLLFENTFTIVVYDHGEEIVRRAILSNPREVLTTPKISFLFNYKKDAQLSCVIFFALIL